jgi:hypothetical protein
MKINKSLFILLPLTSMMLANILYFFNDILENKYSMLSLGLFILITSFFLNKYKIKFDIIETIVIFIISIISIIGFYFYDASLNINLFFDKFVYLSKIIFIIYALIVIKNTTTKDIEVLYNFFFLLLFIIICITLMFYLLEVMNFITLKNRLISYSGRFAALCYELVDFSYLLIISMILIYKKKYWIVFFLFYSFLLYLTTSNSILIFFIALLISYLINHYKLIRINIVFILLLGLFILLYILNSSTDLQNVLNMLEGILPRMSSSLDYSSPTGRRLISNINAIIYLKDSFFEFPLGLNSNSALLQLSGLRQGVPFGILLFIIDFKIISIFILLILLYKLHHIMNVKYKCLNISKAQAIIMVSIFYLTFQGSYFNVTVWTIILLSSRYIKMSIAYQEKIKCN